MKIAIGLIAIKSTPVIQRYLETLLLDECVVFLSNLAKNDEKSIVRVLPPHFMEKLYLDLNAKVKNLNPPIFVFGRVIQTDSWKVKSIKFDMVGHVIIDLPTLLVKFEGNQYQEFLNFAFGYLKFKCLGEIRRYSKEQSYSNWDGDEQR